jgi:hypothetical protein
MVDGFRIAFASFAGAPTVTRGTAELGSSGKSDVRATRGHSQHQGWELRLREVPWSPERSSAQQRRLELLPRLPLRLAGCRA